MVRRKAFLLFELMVFISVISFFIMSFYVFETYSLKTAKSMQNMQEKISLIKNEYYYAMTSPVSDLLDMSQYSVQEIDENYYKFRVVSDDVFSNLFVIRKK